MMQKVTQPSSLERIATIEISAHHHLKMEVCSIIAQSSTNYKRSAASTSMMKKKQIR